MSRVACVESAVHSTCNLRISAWMPPANRIIGSSGHRVIGKLVVHTFLP